MILFHVLASPPTGEPVDGSAVLGLCFFVLVFLLIAGGKGKGNGK